MTFDLFSLQPGERYRILASLVTPRPIAWVTTQDENGNLNAAPFSFFNVFGSNPPIVAFAPGNKDRLTPKDTARNIRATGEFVVHMVDEPLGQTMVATAATLPPPEKANSTVSTSPCSLPPKSPSPALPRRLSRWNAPNTPRLRLAPIASSSASCTSSMCVMV